MQRVLVTGGRDFTDEGLVHDSLYGLHNVDPISALAQGGARGADSLAAAWARLNGVECFTYHARWTQYGKRAGILRNIEMCNAFKPDAVLAFPGGRGTYHMVRYALKCGIPVIEINAQAAPRL